MTGVTRLGTVFLPSQPPERLRETALAADSSGVDTLWVWEDCFKESGIATAAAALAWTTRVGVGIGLLPAPLRNVALTAMELATLERLFPGRLAVTVGHGVQDWMGQVGGRVSSPLTLLSEYTLALRALLAGETVSTQGRYVTLDRVALDHPPTDPSGILVGAIGPKTLELAGRDGAGVVLVGGTTPDEVADARSAVAGARTAAGVAGPPEVVVHLLTATGPDAAGRVAAEAEHWPFEVGPDTAVAGDAAAVAAAVRRWADAGADTVLLQPTADADPAEFARFAGDQVRPLLS